MIEECWPEPFSSVLAQFTKWPFLLLSIVTGLSVNAYGTFGQISNLLYVDCVYPFRPPTQAFRISPFNVNLCHLALAARDEFWLITSHCCMLQTTTTIYNTVSVQFPCLWGNYILLARHGVAETDVIKRVMWIKQTDFHFNIGRSGTCLSN